MCDENMTNCNCLDRIVNKILFLQSNSSPCGQSEGCDKPFLGPNNTTGFNTRPVSFYNCQTGALWSIDGSTVFRLESLDDCCCTCRMLTENDGTYQATNNFFTINLNCCCGIRCYDDIYLDI